MKMATMFITNLYSITILLMSSSILATAAMDFNGLFQFPSNVLTSSTLKKEKHSSRLRFSPLVDNIKSKSRTIIPPESLEMERSLSNEFNTGSFYWFGRDQDGTPTLWYRIDRMDWDNIVFKKRMQYTDLVLKSVLQKMPSDLYENEENNAPNNMNFVLLLDDFSPIQMLKHPKIGPAFLKSFVKTCPGNCLKSAVMVTGTTGHVFYKIVKGIASKSFVSKISVVHSRDAAASMLVEKGIVRSKHELPTFLGGNMEHHGSVTKSLSGMVSSCTN